MAAEAAALQASSGRALPVGEDSAEPQSCMATGSCQPGRVSTGPCGMLPWRCPVGQDKGWAAGHPNPCLLPRSRPLPSICTQTKHLLTEHFE